MRHPRHGDGNQPTPGIIDAGLRQLRKHPRHERAHKARDIGGWGCRIALAAAENQPPVRAEPEIIDHEAAVADSEIIGDERGGMFQRRGGDEIIRHRHDAAGDARLQAPQQRVAGQHAKARAHHAGLRARADAALGFERDGRAMLEQPYPRRARGLS